MSFWKNLVQRKSPPTKENLLNHGGRCPFCGSTLRTEKARQCLSCLMDWHDMDSPRKLRRTRSIKLSLWRKLIGGTKCTNCGALVSRSTVRKKDGRCASCGGSGLTAQIRREAAQARGERGEEPRCGKCSRTESSLHEEKRLAKASGMVVYGENFPSLLYCASCNEYFCGRCQTDLGMVSGCPKCGAGLH
jgi:hypothetical protein